MTAHEEDQDRLAVIDRDIATAGTLGEADCLFLRHLATRLTHERDTFEALWDDETTRLDQQIVASTDAITRLKAENESLHALHADRLRRNRFDCHQCGRGVAVANGCCVQCGTYADEVIPAAHT